MRGTPGKGRIKKRQSQNINAEVRRDTEVTEGAQDKRVIGRIVLRVRGRQGWLRATAVALALMAAALGPRAMTLSGQEPQTTGPVEEAEFNPLEAEKNLKVAEYYLKWGNYDAAIDRLKDAIRYKANYALAYCMLGEAYEKKGRLAEAVRNYEKYLEILPSAKDAKKVRKKIERLKEKVAREPTGQ